MTSTPDDPGDTSPEAPAGLAGRAARDAEQVALLVDIARAGHKLAMQAAEAAFAGDKDAKAFYLRLTREMRQVVALRSMLEGAPPAGKAPAGKAPAGKAPAGEAAAGEAAPRKAPPRDPEAPRAPGPEPGVIYSEGYFDGYTPPPPWTEPTEPWRVEDPRKQHVRECVRLVAVGTSLTDEEFSDLCVALEARLDEPDIEADIAEGREEVQLVSEICADLGVKMNRCRAWPMPPPWGPELPPGTPRSKLRMQAGRDPPAAGG